MRRESERIPLIHKAALRGTGAVKGGTFQCRGGTVGKHIKGVWNRSGLDDCLTMNSSSPSKEALEKCYMCLNFWRNFNSQKNKCNCITMLIFGNQFQKTYIFTFTFSDKASVISVKWVSSEKIIYYFFTSIIEDPRHKKSVSLNRT